MDTVQSSSCNINEVQIDQAIHNYYYKKNYGGEDMRRAHAHNAVEIECIVDGHLLLEFQEGPVHLTKNDIVIIKPNVWHKFGVPATCKTCKRVNIAIYRAAMEMTDVWGGFLDTLISFPGDYVLVEHSDIIRDLMVHVVQELSRKKWGYETVVKAELASLTILLQRSVRKMNNDGKRPSYAQQAKDLIDAAPQEAWTPATLARRLNISASYLMHIFRAEYSVTMMKYLESRRLELAKRMLTDSQKSIDAISAGVGFLTLQHFSYVFKKNMGLAPTQYRKISQEIIYKSVDIE